MLKEVSMTEKAKEEKKEAAEEKPTEETKEAPKEEKKAEKPKESRINIVHGALLLHSAGKDITEASLKKVIDATGAKADEAQIKALVSSLEGVDISEAISQAVAMPSAAAAAPAEEKAAEKEEKSEEQQEKKAEEAAAGLSSLFG